jgi:hypothetical protein
MNVTYTSNVHTVNFVMSAIEGHCSLRTSAMAAVQSLVQAAIVDPELLANLGSIHSIVVGAIPILRLPHSTTELLQFVIAAVSANCPFSSSSAAAVHSIIEAMASDPALLSNGNFEYIHSTLVSSLAIIRRTALK